MKKSFLSKYWVQVSLTLVSLLVHIYIALRPADVLMNWYTSDDGFFYFKVAANIANGLGATFDGISRTNGFHPLWMLVCVPVFWLARFDLILPLRVLVLVSALFHTGTALLIYAILRRHVSISIAAAMALVWIFLPSIHTVVAENGMESAISAFCLALLIYLVTEWKKAGTSPLRLGLLGLVGGLAILARLDNIFVVLLLGAWFVLGQTSAYLRTLVVGDLGLIFMVCLLGYYARLLSGPVYAINSVALPWHLGLSFLLIPLSFFLGGFYRLEPEKLSWKYGLRCILTIAAPAVLVSGLLVVLWKVGVITALPRSIPWIVSAGMVLSLTGLRVLAARTFQTMPGPEPNPVRTWRFWKDLLPRALGIFLPAGAVLGAYMVWSYLYVGVAMPISGTIKHWWGGLSYTVYGSTHRTLMEVFGLSENLNAWPLLRASRNTFLDLARLLGKDSAAPIVATILFILLIGLVVFVFLRDRKWTLPIFRQAALPVIFAGLYAQIFYYSMTSYMHVRAWYWVGQALFTLLCLGIILEAVWRLLQRIHLRPLAWQAFMAMLSTAVLLTFAGMLARFFPPRAAANPADNYMTDTLSLERLTEPGALIGMTGGGQMGYFIQDRTVVNLDGLINGPEYFRLLEAGRGSEYLGKIGLDYVFGMDEMLNHSDPYYGLFKDRLKAVNGSLEVFGDGLQLYHYIPGVVEKFTGQ